VSHEITEAPARSSRFGQAVSAGSVVTRGHEIDGRERTRLGGLERESNRGLMDTENLSAYDSATERFATRLASTQKALLAELAGERTRADALAADNAFLQRMLDDRDRQYSKLQLEFVGMREDRIWRMIRKLRGQTDRLRQLFRPRVRSTAAQSARTLLPKEA
jgi:hypothetical protein